MLLDDFGCFWPSCNPAPRMQFITSTSSGQGVTTAAPQDDRAVLSVAECAGASFFCLVVLLKYTMLKGLNFQATFICQDSTSKRHFETGDVLTCILPHSFCSPGTVGAHAGLQPGKVNEMLLGYFG